MSKKESTNADTFKLLTVQTNEEEIIELTKHLEKYYKFPDIDKIILKKNKYRGWDAKGFILDNKYFVKYWTDNVSDIEDNLLFSYNILHEIMKNTKQEEFEKMNVGIPSILLNNEGNPITKVEGTKMIVVSQFVEGDMIGKKITNHFNDIYSFLKYLHENSEKFVKAVRNLNIPIIESDFTNKNHLSLIKKMINESKEILENLKTKVDLVKENYQIIQDFLDEFKIISKGNKKVSLVVSHTDLHGWNIIQDISGFFWIVDWDFLMLSHFEHDLSYCVDDRHMDIDKNPLDAILKILTPSKLYEFDVKNYALSYFYRINTEINMVLKRLRKSLGKEDHLYELNVCVLEVKCYNKRIKKMLSKV